MFRLNSKGQEEAPFELLISVIIMGFVLSVGFMAMNELAKKQCQGSIEETMRDLKTKLEIVSKGQGKESFKFAIPSCYSEVKSKLVIRSISERITCSRLCGGNRLDCTLLEFYGYAEDGSSYVSETCLDIPPTTDFPTYTPGLDNICEPDKYKTGNVTYDVVSWKDNPIMPGNYILANEYSLMSDYPRICVYRRVV